jgi:hypothetical protein
MIIAGGAPRTYLARVRTEESDAFTRAVDGYARDLSWRNPSSLGPLQSAMFAAFIAFKDTWVADEAIRLDGAPEEGVFPRGLVVHDKPRVAVGRGDSIYLWRGKGRERMPLDGALSAVQWAPENLFDAVALHIRDAEVREVMSHAAMMLRTARALRG